MPGGFTVRGAESYDLQTIQKIVQKDEAGLTQRFADFNLTFLIEHTTLALTALDADRRVVGFASFLDFPRHEAVDQTNWTVTFQRKYSRPELTTSNTLWLSFLAAEKGPAESEITQLLLKTAFMTLPEHDHFLALVPSIATRLGSLAGLFEHVDSKATVPEWDTRAVYRCSRTKFVQKLAIRRARVEDHDDLIPIFAGNDDPVAREAFFLARLIENQDDVNKSLVGTAGGTAVGLIGLSSAIDLADLQQSFFLERFDNLQNDRGENTAFCVRVFALSDEHESRAIDFLLPAFEAFPSKEWLLLTLPHQADSALSRYMTVVRPRPGTSFPNVLYVAHRRSFAETIAVAPAIEPQREEIGRFLRQQLPESESDAGFLAAIGKPGGLKTVVVTASALGGNAAEVAGAALVDTEVDAERLRNHFEVEDFVNAALYQPSDYVLLRRLVISPRFENRRLQFVQELLRNLRKRVVFYKTDPDWPAPSVTQDFVRLQPRKATLYTPDEIGSTEHAYALYVLPSKLIFEPRSIVNDRIVVVGASDVGVSFLETMAFLPHRFYSYLTLVSPGGLPTQSPPFAPFLPTSLCYTPLELRQLALADKVTVVGAKMLEIDRNRKALRLSNGQFLSYDYLVLATGLQDQTATSLLAAEFDSVRGVFVLSNEQAQERLHAALRDEFVVGAEDNAVLVYGTTLTAYTALQGLLAAGVPPAQIVHVHPPSTAAFTCFNDATVDAKVSEYLESLDGLRTLEAHALTKIEHADGAVTGVVLRNESSKAKVTVEAKILITSDQTAVDPDTFRAIIQSSLVYDGKLVIDSAFRTNDTSIYAFGGLAKFSRRSANQSNLLAFEHYNSRELGVELAGSFLRSCKEQSLTETMVLAKAEAVHKFVAPKLQGGVLPGGLQYFHAHVPCLPAPKPPQDLGRDLVTSQNDDYVCIHIDKYGVVDAITYLGPVVVETDNFLKLMGLNEKFANNMVARYDEGVIPDFVSFFRDAWAMALFHDRFREFVNEARDQLMLNTSVQQLAKQAAQFVDLDGKIDPEIKEKLRDQLQAQAVHLVQLRLVEYLRTNHPELPMYHIPELQYVVPPPPRPESSRIARGKLSSAKPAAAARPGSATAQPRPSSAAAKPVTPKPAADGTAAAEPAARPPTGAAAKADSALGAPSSKPGTPKAAPASAAAASAAASAVPPAAAAQTEPRTADGAATKPAAVAFSPRDAEPADEDEEQILNSKLATPASARSVASEAGKRPSAPAADAAESNAPRADGASKPSTPAASNPATPAASKPATPATSKPATPAASKPATPAASKPTTPAASKPTTPAASKPTTPAASKPATPAASEPSTPKADSAPKPETPRSSVSATNAKAAEAAGSRPVSTAQSPRDASRPASASASAAASPRESSRAASAVPAAAAESPRRETSRPASAVAAAAAVPEAEFKVPAPRTPAAAAAAEGGSKAGTPRSAAAAAADLRSTPGEPAAASGTPRSSAAKPSPRPVGSAPSSARTGASPRATPTAESPRAVSNGTPRASEPAPTESPRAE